MIAGGVPAPLLPSPFANDLAAVSQSPTLSSRVTWAGWVLLLGCSERDCRLSIKLGKNIESPTQCRRKPPAFKMRRGRYNFTGWAVFDSCSKRSKRPWDTSGALFQVGLPVCCGCNESQRRDFWAHVSAVMPRCVGFHSSVQGFR